MKRPNLVPRIVVLALILAGALASSSCDSGSGVGVGMNYPARWGGGTSGPPIFVGGPGL
jgi:hypothetical protein